MSNVAHMNRPMPALAVAGNIPQFVLPDRLRKAREVADMTQTQLAEVMGLSRRSVSYYESGESVPKRPQLIAWAMATGVSLTWLETGQDASRPRQGDPDGGEGLPRRDLNQRPSGYMSAQVIAFPGRAA